MSEPLVITLSHSLGTEEAKRRIGASIGKLGDQIPGGAAEVRSAWAGDTLTLLVRTLGQEVTSRIEVEERLVRIEVVLPALLGMFGKKIAGLIRGTGKELLEDKRRT